MHITVETILSVSHHGLFLCTLLVGVYHSVTAIIVVAVASLWVVASVIHYNCLVPYVAVLVRIVDTRLSSKPPTTIRNTVYAVVK